jgi:hypothetical protein
LGEHGVLTAGKALASLMGCAEEACVKRCGQTGQVCGNGGRADDPILGWRRRDLGARAGSRPSLPGLQ